MSLAFASVLFLAVTLVWILLPLVPAFHELRFKTDAEPLRVVRRSDTNIRHFALGFRGFLQKHFATHLDRCELTDLPQIGELTDGTPFCVLPETVEEPPVDQENPSTEEDPHLVISCGNLKLDAAKTYPREVYARGSLSAGKGASLRAALADQSIYLGDGCTSYRWLHANGEIHVGQACTLYGRVSADRLIKMGDDCRFERLHAPRIEFGTPAAPHETPEEVREIDLEKLPRFADHSADRYLFRRQLEIPAGGHVEGDIVVTGKLKIGAGARIDGSIKSHDDLELADNVRIAGSVVSGKNMRLGEGCALGGPVVAEQRAEIGAGCTFGDEENPTTLSARGLKIASGVVAYGTVWGGDS